MRQKKRNAVTRSKRGAAQDVNPTEWVNFLDRECVLKWLRRLKIRRSNKKADASQKEIEASIMYGALLMKQANLSVNETKKMVCMYKKWYKLMVEAGNVAHISEEQSKEIEEQLRAEASQKRNDSSSNSSNGTVKRKADVPDRVTWYWNSLNSEEKKALLKIRISDIKRLYSYREVIEEAIFFEKAFNSSWKYWSCGRCKDILATSELFIEHVQQKHLDCLWPETEISLPETAGDEWVDLLVNCCWEPVELNAAIEQLSKYDSKSLFDWPLSKDHERTELLKIIKSLFHDHIKHGCLSSDLVSKVIKFAVDELKGLACGSAAEFEVNQTPVCIRLLGAPELKRIKIFLEEVTQACGICALIDKTNLGRNTVQGVEITEIVRLEEDGSLLVIDEQSLPCKIDDVSCAPNPSHVVVYENGVILDSDALLSWIFTGASSSLSAQLASWKRAKVQTQKYIQTFYNLEKVHGSLVSFNIRKTRLASSEEALIVLESLKSGHINLDQFFGGITAETCKTNGIMLRIGEDIDQLKHELADQCFHDFRSILLSLVKSFLKAHVDRLAMIESTKKADAAKVGKKKNLNKATKSKALGLKGTGLKNEGAAYNCFLNVIIQCLWHLHHFREELLEKSSEHKHIGDPCIVCALCSIFQAMNVVNSNREAVAPTQLRVALSRLYPMRSFFKEGQMNDAAELLDLLLECLHDSSTTVCEEDSQCLAHVTFGLNIKDVARCETCDLVIKCSKYTCFSHTVSAAALREKKAKHPENSFDKLLNRVEMNHPLSCDPVAKGCGKEGNRVKHCIVLSPPQVLTVAVGWQSCTETAEDIRATLNAISTQIDAKFMFDSDGDAEVQHSRHCLVSMVCYVGMHYICFVYDEEHMRWELYNDQSVEVIGGWNDVVSICLRRMLQPQVLFFKNAD